MTFLFKAPPEVRTVELLGSWDNFSRSYYMHHDTRRGRGFWSGCFNFKDIIFDGDKVEWSKPRNGGLKQGGTYWYFYRLNDVIEAYDDFQAYTQRCPLLPGQTVNVMDVPVETEDPPARRRSAGFEAAGTSGHLRRTLTLDADDKWQALEPPPRSKVHDRCISDLALNGRLETKPHSLREAHRSPPVSPPSVDVQSTLAVSRQQSAGDENASKWRNRWSSAPASRAESSIFDAYSIEDQSAEVASLSAFPLPHAHGVNARPTTRHGSSTGNKSGFALEPANTRHPVSRSGDDDLDETSFVSESAGSPPRSAYGSVDCRFTVTPARCSSSILSSGSDRQRRHGSETQRSHRPSVDSTTNSSPEPDVFDLCSPTFSAATISSNGGELHTPFRLSANYVRTTAPPSAAHENQRDAETSTSIEHVTERLRLLGSEDSAGSLPSQISEDVDADARPVVGHYALPVHNGIAAQSATTLGKASSGHASVGPHDVPPLPATTRALGHEDSFADSIFDELGYLGASIA